MMERCRTCRFYVAGHCDYRPPPALLRLIAMAHHEPATMIDWEAETQHPPQVDPNYVCSEWRARG